MEKFKSLSFRACAGELFVGDGLRLVGGQADRLTTREALSLSPFK